jgi:DNA (cytosine-5)-methyltransferase 1
MDTATSQLGRNVLIPMPKVALDELVYRSRISGELRAPTSPYKVIDLFSGAGGLSAGFTRFSGHYFEPVLALDNNASAIDTYNANFGDHGRCVDILQLIEEEPASIPRADIVIGGPPCQGFSTLNRDRDIKDERRQMWRPYMKIVELSGASVFVIENVPQLLDSPEFLEIAEEAVRLGFTLTPFKLLAADYGAPQARKRAVIIGSKLSDISSLTAPKKTHFNPARPLNNAADFILHPLPWRTVRDTISNLPEPEGTEMRDVPAPANLHFGRRPTEISKRRYKVIPEGGNRFDLEKNAPELNLACWKKVPTGRTDLFGRLWWDRPSVTIRTEFFKPEKGRYLHPVQHRPITHREAARLQGFDDSFIFKGNKLQIAKQIGNAVPVQLAARIADSVYALLVSPKY